MDRHTISSLSPSLYLSNSLSPSLYLSNSPSPSGAVEMKEGSKERKAHGREERTPHENEDEGSSHPH